MTTDDVGGTTPDPWVPPGAAHSVVPCAPADLSTRLALDPSVALSVGMLVVPHLYSRNRMFQLFENAAFRRARVRARLVASVLADVVRIGADATFTVEGRADGDVSLRYTVERLRFARRVDLRPWEWCCLRYIAARQGSAVLGVGPEDGRVVAQALALLPEGKGGPRPEDAP